MTEPEQKHFLVRPETLRWLWRGGLAVLALLVIGDVLVHGHPHFQIDGSFGFYAWYGFATCVGMILLAKLLGVLLKRGDDYYDR